MVIKQRLGERLAAAIFLAWPVDIAGHPTGQSAAFFKVFFRFVVFLCFGICFLLFCLFVFVCFVMFFCVFVLFLCFFG